MAHTHLKNHGEILLKSWKEPTRVPILWRHYTDDQHQKTKISHYDLWLVMILISWPSFVRRRPPSDMDRLNRSMCGRLRIRTVRSIKIKKRNRVTLEMSRISSRTFSGFYRLTLRSHNKEKTGLNKLTFNLFWPRKLTTSKVGFDYRYPQSCNTYKKCMIMYIHVTECMFSFGMCQVSYGKVIVVGN